ncbi:MAG TPA: oligosaccharide flippase family protein [Vicinamibacterales bacterium]|nr:oligosaccharide flippase family protein [Vicinamibacterales bacterium]
MSRNTTAIIWEEQEQARIVALNVIGRYATLALEMVVGLLMLPFNANHLGASEYGLWMLAASIIAYFPVLDLGLGSAMERAVARHRAERNPDAINEVASTLVFVFAATGLVALVVVATVAWNIGHVFDLPAAQAHTGRILMMMIGAQVAIGLPFTIFGGVVNGFQRTYLNGIVGACVSLSVVAVNVLVLWSGGGLVELVGCITATRLLGYVAYRLNAYRVFPLLRIRPSLFRKARLRELTGFGVWMMVQNAACKVNYGSDVLVIGAFLTTGSVAVWTVAQRLADAVLQVTNQLNYVLFPIVVGADTSRRNDRLAEVLVQGTRLSLATILPVAGSLALLADSVVLGWTGPRYAAASVIVKILAIVVLVRVGSWAANTVLLGAGSHQLVATSNAISAAINIALSVLFIRWWGLPGVAIATLLPVTARAVLVVIPVACARVGMSLRAFFATAVWPAVWPALVVLAGLAIVRNPASTSLFYALLEGAIGGLIYAILFVGVAIGPRDRTRYLGKLRNLAGWPQLEAA